MIALDNIILHRLDKQVQGNATVVARTQLIAVRPQELAFIESVKEAYYKKSNPSYGVFDSNVASYPFQTLLRAYIDRETPFYEFTIAAMNHFRAVINAVPQATGGYVLFAHYHNQAEEFVITVVLSDKIQYNIDDQLSINEILGIDIERMDVANFVNITRWNGAQDTYLSFSRGRKEVSNYFRTFIGCTDQTSARQSSLGLKKAFLDYLVELPLPDERKEELRNEVFNYCAVQARRKEDISLHHISSMIDNTQPDLFEQFAATETYHVGPVVKPHLQTLKSIKYFVYKSRDLNISFDSSLINHSIFYNEQANELRITNVPEQLRVQLTGTEDQGQ